MPLTSPTVPLSHPTSSPRFSLTFSPGGCALAFAVNAACATLDSSLFRLYSALGNFLSGASCQRLLHATVTTLRSTRTFQTRVVLVTQTLDDGSSRAVLSANLDFQAIEPAEMLRYSEPLPALAGTLDDALAEDAYLARVRRIDGCTDRVLAAYHAGFAPALKYFDRRAVWTGVGAQNLVGVLQQAPTTQDHRPLTDKVSYDWSRSRAPLATYRDTIVALAFQMDAAIAFSALTHSHRFLPDAAACGSLDFALRFFGSDLDMNHFHLREIRTLVGREGRTYNESKMWDRDGKLVCVMTQQAILRPKKGQGTPVARM